MKSSTKSVKLTRREELQRTCAGCEMPAADWPGVGIVRNGERYCCEGCANGTGCTCEPRPRVTTQ